MAARPLLSRQPNARLDALIQEARYSNAGLARRVNMRGAKLGLDLRYDKTSVSRWVRGQRPRGKAAMLIAEVLSERLERTVSLEDIGMAFGRNPVNGTGLHFAPSIPQAVENCLELWAADADPRGPLVRTVVSVSSMIGPSRDWLIAPPDSQVTRGEGSRVVGADVEAVRATQRALAELDHKFGAGHVRHIAVHYLNSFVSGLIQGAYTEAIGRGLFGAVAQFTKFTGDLAVDIDRPGLAQRYYIQALRLSQMANDRRFGAHILADGMSRLAPEFGHPQEVVQLALTARGGVRESATSRMRALFHAAEARGHALMGDVVACEAALSKALEAMEQIRGDTDPEWGIGFDRTALAEEFAHCYRDLRLPEQSVRWAEEALAGQPDSRVRRRTIDLLLLATAWVELGETERACHTATMAVELMEGLRSHLADRSLCDFRRRLVARGGDAAVKEFNGRLSARGSVDAGR